MIRYLRDFRLIPIVLLATVALFVLKTTGLLTAGRYALEPSGADDGTEVTGAIAGTPPAGAESGGPSDKRSWAQEMLGYPGTTGSVKATKTAELKPVQGSGGMPEEPKDNRQGWKPVPLDGVRRSPAETAILERLQERRNELDARMKELEMRENLIKAAEKRLEGRIGELKELEARVNAASQQREEGDVTRLKNVVTMFENMKAKEAAKIFDRLEIKVLVDVATQINPRRMSDILAQMLPESAERLTVELAARSGGKDKPADLPKIEGKPSPN